MSLSIWLQLLVRDYILILVFQQFLQSFKHYNAIYNILLKISLFIYLFIYNIYLYKETKVSWKSLISKSIKSHFLIVLLYFELV